MGEEPSPSGGIGPNGDCLQEAAPLTNSSWWTRTPSIQAAGRVRNSPVLMEDGDNWNTLDWLKKQSRCLPQLSGQLNE